MPGVFHLVIPIVVRANPRAIDHVVELWYMYGRHRHGSVSWKSVPVCGSKVLPCTQQQARRCLSQLFRCQRARS